MDVQQPDPALQAANRTFTGRRLERALSRFASIELRELGENHSPRNHLAWEMAAVTAVGLAAFISVIGLWCF